jgi:hypothetical protein
LVGELPVSGLSEFIELGADLWLVSGRNSKLLTVCKSVLLVFDAGAADFTASHATVGASHVLLSVGGFEELNSLHLWLLLFLLWLLFLLLDENSWVFLLAEVTGSHVLTTFVVVIVLLNGFVISLGVEALISHVVVCGSIFHLAVD